MNSEVLIVDTTSIDRSAMHDWWHQHKEVMLYPRPWADGAEGDSTVASDRLVQYILGVIEKGVLVITEDDQLKRKLKRYFANLPVKSGGICCGDAILYDTPIASVLNGEVMWWSTDEEVDNIERDFTSAYCTSSIVI